MAKVTQQWIDFDVQTLEGVSTQLRVFLAVDGGLERTATGIKIKATGVTNGMLAGSIALEKLVKAVVVADGSQDFTADQSMGGNSLTNLAQGSNPTDAVTFQQLQSSMTGLDFQADILGVQEDATLDPGTPNTGDRYVIVDPANLSANFGTIAGIGANDVVEYNGTDFVVSYDVSVAGSGALCWDRSATTWKSFDGTGWTEFGGLSGITTGDGLDKTGNTIQVKVSDLAGTGIEADGSNNLRLAAQGNGLTGGAGTILSVEPDVTTGGDTAPVSVGASGVGVDVSDLDGDHLSVDFTPANYTPDIAPAEADDLDDLAAHLKGIDVALANAGSGSATIEYHEVTAAEISNGYFSLVSAPEAANLISVTPFGGPLQANKQSISATGITADFDVLNSIEVHINNNGDASGLSDCFSDGDVLIVSYPRV